jgi:phosphopentomutase
MTRAIIGVLDSFGLGASEDAGRYGDIGADTFGHIVEACEKGAADRDGLRRGPLHIPNLLALGLAHASEEATGRRHRLPKPAKLEGVYGFAAERSRGKDTPSGHWEMMGLPVDYDWGYFPKGPPSFPKALLDQLIEEAGLPGVIGDRHASGTDIIEELGEAHIQTGKPIVYTSGDSVFQIATHETHFGLERLYATCLAARRLVDEYRIGRVIARPFIGERRGEFRRTGARRDYATPPHGATLLDRANRAGRAVIGIGKIGDIFAQQGLTQSVKAEGNLAIFDAMLSQMRAAPDGSIIFANFVDFDTLYGHRRDVAGYAAALEAFDRRIPELRAALRPDDIVIFTADHGCDPTAPGSDHTREFVPVLAFGPQISPRSIGRRTSFADIGQTLAARLHLEPTLAGEAFL